MDASHSRLTQLVATAEPAALGPQPRRSRQAVAELNEAINVAFEASELSNQRQELVRALLLLWHDHLDASHEISQTIETADGSLVHAIMHRREPDYWNSKYWWRRVGNHPAFPELAKRVDSMLQQRGEAVLAKQLLPGGKWNPDAFVDACEAAADAGSVEQTRLLQDIQRIETEVVLEYFLER